MDESNKLNVNYYLLLLLPLLSLFLSRARAPARVKHKSISFSPSILDFRSATSQTILAILYCGNL